MVVPAKARKVIIRTNIMRFGDSGLRGTTAPFIKEKAGVRS